MLHEGASKENINSWEKSVTIDKQKRGKKLVKEDKKIIY